MDLLETVLPIAEEAIKGQGQVFVLPGATAFGYEEFFAVRETSQGPQSAVILSDGTHAWALNPLDSRTISTITFSKANKRAIDEEVYEQLRHLCVEDPQAIGDVVCTLSRWMRLSKQSPRFTAGKVNAVFGFAGRVLVRGVCTGSTSPLPFSLWTQEGHWCLQLGKKHPLNWHPTSHSLGG